MRVTIHSIRAHQPGRVSGRPYLGANTDLRPQCLRWVLEMLKQCHRTLLGPVSSVSLSVQSSISRLVPNSRTGLISSLETALLKAQPSCVLPPSASGQGRLLLFNHLLKSPVDGPRQRRDRRGVEMDKACLWSIKKSRS
jgi:hypothetical protein